MSRNAWKVEIYWPYSPNNMKRHCRRNVPISEWLQHFNTKRLYRSAWMHWCSSAAGNTAERSPTNVCLTLRISSRILRGFSSRFENTFAVTKNKVSATVKFEIYTIRRWFAFFRTWPVPDIMVEWTNDIFEWSIRSVVQWTSANTQYASLKDIIERIVRNLVFEKFKEKGPKMLSS